MQHDRGPWGTVAPTVPVGMPHAAAAVWPPNPPTRGAGRRGQTSTRQKGSLGLHAPPCRTRPLAASGQAGVAGLHRGIVPATKGKNHPDPQQPSDASWSGEGHTHGGSHPDVPEKAAQSSGDRNQMGAAGAAGGLHGAARGGRA